MTKIFHHASAAPAAAPAGVPAGVPASPAAGAGVGAATGAEMASSMGGAGSAAVQGGGTAAPAAVDVGAVLAEMAKAKGGGGNYQTSIVDLLHLLDMDSSIGARHTLAEEMGVHAGADGTAEQNIALHKAVVAKLAENGGIVPASMKA